MEFLNDFLEVEAPRMSEFLHQISTRSTQPPPDTVLDWPGYIDEGKQLAILHHLLSESIPKLPQNRQADLGPLPSILETITCSKVSNSVHFYQDNNNSIMSQQTVSQKSSDGSRNVSQTIIKPLGNGERGIMRGVLTPSSLEKNIFRYNDPTVSPLLSQQLNGSKGDSNPLNQSQSSINGSLCSNPIQHSHSTSSISNVCNYQEHLMPPSKTVHHHHHRNHAPSPERFHYMQQQQQQEQNARNFNTTSHYYSSQSVSGGHRSPVIRANTLPRNNNADVLHSPDGDGSKNLIQIGVDTSSAFVRKSPTPNVKSNQRQRNSSQLSLLSERGGINGSRNYPNLNFNLGIPHNENHKPLPSTNHNSNMPMKLEDLDDLLKYADEHASVNGDELKPSKGSNTSIAHCSSGYHSIATHSQSSTSPVEQSVSGDYVNHNGTSSSLKATRRAQKQTKFGNAKFGNGAKAFIPNGIINPPLAFKNPLYQLQNGNNNSVNAGEVRVPHIYTAAHSRSSPKSSSLTPSSSDERLSNPMNDKYFSSMDENNGNTIGVQFKAGNSNGTLSSSGGGNISDREHSIGSSRRINSTSRLAVSPSTVSNHPFSFVALFL